MPTKELVIPERKPRRFLPDDLTIDSWNRLEPFFRELKDRTIDSASALEKWMADRSELEAVLSENLGWRYIHMTCDTENTAKADSYNFFISEIEPFVAPYQNEFDKKLMASKFLSSLNKDKYSIYLRDVKQRLEIYREENIPLITEIQTEAHKYSAIAGAMSVNINGQEVTIQMAMSHLKDTNRAVREEVFNKIHERRMADRDTLDELYNRLLKIRHQVALNAGYKNYRDYKFADLCRFDYNTDDCRNFHDSIEKEIVPIVEAFDRERKKTMGLEPLRAWDLEVDPNGEAPLKPFATGEELMERSIQCFRNIRPFFGECLEIMRAMKNIDLESRLGKAPGGYNYPLYEIGVPFIFMNSVGTLRDLVTMVHEGGHAIHSFLSKDLEITDFKSTPSEVAELASMSMELISMEHWDVFFPDPNDLKRAKREQLEKILKILPWIAAVDKFQHWVYENPQHTTAQRWEAWKGIIGSLSSSVIDWGKGLSGNRNWQNQIHIFEIPFYYIEYGMAQLGAIAMWRNYKRDPQKALDQYEKALQLGYTRSIGDIYAAAGIRFDFSREYVKELAAFVREELEKTN